MSDPTATLQREEALAFLRRHAPFDRLASGDLGFLVDRMRQVGFPKATTLVAPESGIPECLYVVLRGRVTVVDSGAAGSIGEVQDVLEVGECFPIAALTAQRPTVRAFISREPVDCYAIAASDFRELMSRSPEFSQFCSGYLASLVSRSYAQMQARLAQQVTELQSLDSKLGQLVKRPPFAVTAETPLLDVFKRMVELRVGSTIVIGDNAAPIGILTQSDLLDRVVLPGVSLDQAISSVMSPDPFALPESARACDAVLAMATRNIRHVLVVDAAGRLKGVVSERDLFALQRIGLRQIRQDVVAAENIEVLQRAATDVRQFALNMLAQGIAAEQLTQFISALNDAITRRVIELNMQRHDVGGIEWAWLAFGSEGREEQTLATDQDNGIVFLVAAEDDPESSRQALLAMARDINVDLDACGFTLCKGDIMAGNPQWCLTLGEWQAKFSRWIRSPEPQALLNATIFFDFRTIFGPTQLADRMHEHLFGLSRPNLAFQHMLAANALTVAPPLGVFRDFVTESADGGPSFIDLKKFGSRLFIDAARVFALAHGIAVANTGERLRRTAQLQGGSGGGDVDAAVDAFNFIQFLRLRHQHLAAARGEPGDNRVPLDELNQLDRRILKESFRQARSLQHRLKLNYQL